VRRFIIRVLLFASILIGVHVFLFLTRPQGMMGGDYERFASPQYKSLVLGTSMAAIDVDPEVIADRLSEVYAMPIYNFAFTIDESPYGCKYNKMVLGKLVNNPNCNSLFILCVDPCSLGLTNVDRNGVPTREDDKEIYRLHSVSSSNGINLEYFIKNVFLHRDFYHKPSERCIRYTPCGRRDTRRVWGIDGEDSLIVEERWENTNKPYYQKIIENYSFSEDRLEALDSLINILRPNGDVFLVYLPVGPEFQQMLNSILPDFEKRMISFAEEKGINFVNFSGRSRDFQTTDGIHLYGEEAMRLTEEICDSILVR